MDKIERRHRVGAKAIVLILIFVWSLLPTNCLSDGIDNDKNKSFYGKEVITEPLHSDPEPEIVWVLLVWLVIYLMSLIKILND